MARKKPKTEYELTQIANKAYNTTSSLLFDLYAKKHGKFYTNEEYIKASKYLHPMKAAHKELINKINNGTL